jgi:recombination protein RecR
MSVYTEPINKLIEALSRLPGVGGKSAQRLAFHIIDMHENDIIKLTDIILDAKRNIRYCTVCCNLTADSECRICNLAEAGKRDARTIMVVEDVRDMAAYERTKQYKGVYHILHGAVSPLTGVSADALKIKELLRRLSDDSVNEVILATNPNIEGEATAMYLSKLLKPLEIKVTRIANGVPVGGDLEYVDEVTLYRALEGRREM